MSTRNICFRANIYIISFLQPLISLQFDGMFYLAGGPTNHNAIIFVDVIDKKKTNLQQQAKSERKLLQTYVVTVPIDNSLLYSSPSSVQILNMFHPVMNFDFYHHRLMVTIACIELFH